MEIKKTKSINLNQFFNVKFNKRYPIISCMFAIAGIIVGVIIQAVNEYAKSGTISIFTQFYSQNSNHGFFEIFFSGFIYNMLIIVFLMFLGFSAVGFAFVYIAPFFKGMGIGALCGYIYSAYLFKGVLYCCVLIFPTAVIEFATIILACNESVQMSHDILKTIQKNGDAEFEIRTDLFALRYAIIAFATAVASILYSIGSIVFFRFL